MADDAQGVARSLVPETYLDKRLGQPARGRPTTRTEEIIADICKGLEAGLTLRNICSDQAFPNRATVVAWSNSDPELKQRIADARARGCNALAEECMDIADDSSNDYVDREVSQGRMTRVLDSEHVQRSKLRIDTRLKLAAVWDPKNYGPKLAVDGKVDIGLEALVLAVAGRRIGQADTPMRHVTPPTDDGSDLI